MEWPKIILELYFFAESSIGISVTSYVMSERNIQGCSWVVEQISLHGLGVNRYRVSVAHELIWHANHAQVFIDVSVWHGKTLHGTVFDHFCV